MQLCMNSHEFADAYSVCVLYVKCLLVVKVCYLFIDEDGLEIPRKRLL